MNLINKSIVSTLLQFIFAHQFTPTISIPNLSKHPIIIVVSFDGFRYDYLEKFSTPTLNQLKASGVSVPYMIPSFPTNTFPNHHSIATGLYPESHGVVDNVFFDPNYNKVLHYRKGNDQNVYWNYDNQVLPLWITNEMAGDGRASGCVMWPGAFYSYGSNNLRPTYNYPDYNKTLSWEDRVDSVIKWVTNDTNPANLVFLYDHQPDFLGHTFGPNDPRLKEEVEKTDNKTAHLITRLKQIGIYDKVNLIFLSDHGMEVVALRNVVNITKFINSSLVETKYGHTSLIHLMPKKGKGDELYGSLKQSESDHTAHDGSKLFSVWRKEETPAHFHYTQSRRLMDIILMASPGILFDDFLEFAERINLWRKNDSEMGREYGVHGYSPEEVSMRAFFIASGPAFRKGYMHEPIRNVDVAPLISEILGLPQRSFNGSLERVYKMIEPKILM